MSTRATIAIKENNRFTHIYVHYDAYPERMLKILEHHTDEAILAAKEIRSIDADEIEAFTNAREPKRGDLTPVLTESYLYFRDEDGAWQVR
jgi:hypothetical protein